jgi:cobalamin biosynthesis Mg chelatase CobN
MTNNRNNSENLINLMREKVQNREKARLIAEDYNALLQKELDLMTSLTNQNGLMPEELQKDEKVEEIPAKVNLKRKTSQRSNSSNSSSSDSSSCSSSSSDSSSDDTSSSEDEQNGAKSAVPVQMPSDLRSAKRKSVSKMMADNQPVKHKHFDEEEDESSIVVEPKIVHDTPNVIRTEIRLYNPNFVYTPNQLKRFRAEKRRQQQEAQEDYLDEGFNSHPESSQFVETETNDEQRYEEGDVNGDTIVSGHHSPDDEVNYEKLDVCTVPKKGMKIAYKVIKHTYLEHGVIRSVYA